jgi:2-methylisocitrate lyase-like PEP mutase family enzyme
MAMTGAKQLRELMNKQDHIIVAPGVYDGLSARIALAAGAECLYMVPPLCPLSSPPQHH